MLSFVFCWEGSRAEQKYDFEELFSGTCLHATFCLDLVSFFCFASCLFLCNLRGLGLQPGTSEFLFDMIPCLQLKCCFRVWYLNCVVKFLV